MPDETYRIIYVVDPSKALQGLAKIDGALKKTQGEIQKTAGMLKTLGQNTPGLKQAEAELKKVGGQLGTVVSAANKAEEELKDVGKGNSSVGSLTKRLEGLDVELKQKVPDARAAADALKGVGKGVNLPGGAGGGMMAIGGRTLLRAGVIGASLATFRRGLGAGGAAVADQRSYLEGTYGLLNDFRSDLAQYASLRGESGPNDKIVREAARFGQDTGIRPEGIVPFLTEYEGSAATGRMAGNIGGVVGRDGFTKAKQEALEVQLKTVGGQFAVRTGLDPQTAGDLTGVASMYTRFNSGKDLAGQLGGMHYGLDQGRGDITPLARGELGQAGSAIKSGRVSGLPELGAFIGVASTVSKSAASAGTTYGQITRLLNETGDDKGEFLKVAGVADKKGDFAKLKALRDHIRVAQSQGAAQDVNTYLQQNGFGNSTDRRSTIGMLENVDVLEQRIAEANRIAANGDEVLARNAANQRQPDATAGRTEATDFANTMESGLMMAPLMQGRAAATAKMKDPNQPGGQSFKAGFGEGVLDLVRTTANLGTRTGEQARVDAETVGGLFARGDKAGVDLRLKYPDLSGHQFAWDVGVQEQDFAKSYTKASAEVDAAEKIKQAAALMKQAGDAMGRGGQQGPTPPGNAGAGVNPGRR